MEEKTKRKKIFNSRPLFYGFLALMLAVSVSRNLFMGDVKHIVFVAVVLCAFTAYCIFYKKFKVLVSILVIFLFGLGWFFVGQAGFQGKIYEEPCQIVGRISDDVRDLDTRAEIVLTDVTINGEKSKNIRLMLNYSDGKKPFELGDVIEFEASLTNNHLFELGLFNLNDFRDGTAYTCYISSANMVVTDNFLTADEKFRLKVKDVLYDSMGEENGAVAFAVLFGDKNDVDSEIKDNYKISGIIHLMTVSGLHVTFLISLLGFILNKCKIRRWLNFIICFAFLGVYAWLCGWSPSVLRAGIMGLVLLFTKITGKCYDNLSSLGLAGIIILLTSPLSALDNGFLMSFFCVGGIFIVSPWLSKLLRKVFPKFVAESFAISIASQIMIFPFMGVFFSQVNLLSFFVNLIVVPFFSVLYPLLFVSTLLSLAMPFCAFLLKGCGFGFSFIAMVAEFFAQTNLLVSTQPIDIFICMFLFVFLFLLARYFMTSRRVKAVCCSTVFALCGIFMGVSAIPTTTAASISFCSWYGYSSILITTQSGQSAIVDCPSYQLTYKLMQKKDMKVIDNYFVLNDWGLNGSLIQDFSVNNIISLEDFSDNDKAYMAKQNEVATIGDFVFQYVAYNGDFLGLEISFDGLNLFVASDELPSYESTSVLDDKRYEFVWVGEYGFLADYFDSEFACGLYSWESLDYNYNQHGNMTCVLKNDKFIWRCLD